MFYAYILRCSDDSSYVGSSGDTDRQLIAVKTPTLIP
jgi:predicted GIY-YIG superfamily endonuclease